MGMRRENTSTSVVDVENRMLLVPLSNMIERVVDNRDVVFPLTAKRGDESCQVAPDRAGREAKTRFPENIFAFRNKSVFSTKRSNL